MTAGFIPTAKKKHLILAAFAACASAGLACAVAIRRRRNWYRASLNIMLEAQRQYNQRQAGQHQQILRLHHDMKNQLRASQHLADHTQAAQHVERLGQLLNEVPLIDYCNRPVLNALLDMKIEEGKRESIGWNVTCTADLSSYCHIDDVDLCRIFSNLLDNAISACRVQAQNGQEATLIEVEVFERAGFLFIKVINRCDTAEAQVKRQNRRQRGLGLRIVHEIAKDYGGNFSLSFDSGEATALCAVPV